MDFSKVTNCISKAVEDLAFPGGVIAVGNNSETIFLTSFGHHTYSKKKEILTTDIFDLASLSKVCATVPATMLLYETGKITFRRQSGRYSSSD